MTNLPATPAQLAIPSSGVIGKLLSGELKLPDEITKVIDVKGWAESLITGVPYVEPDENYLSRMLLLQTLTSDTIDEVFKQGQVKGLQEAIPNVPGAGTGPIEITSLYVSTSDFKEGASMYLILDTTSMLHGTTQKYSTGAGQVQAQVMAALCMGAWPLKCQITRTDRKDKGDRYMFWLIPPDTQDAPF